ncbi:MAG: bifunctional riboflavin kinase/FAD synthetase [Rubricoccaceae bacterium]
MRIETAPDLQRDARSVLTTGTFDGVHRGHQEILRYLVRRANEVDGVPTVVSFDPHPREVLGGGRIPLLTTLDERAELLADLGIERFVVLPFTRDLSLLEPEAYIEDVLIGQVGLREIVIGYDHRFGKGRAGDRSTLERVGAQHGFSVDVIPAHIQAGQTVSSSRIRRQLEDEGAASEAAHLLGRPYVLAGTVIAGDQRGRTLGFPTANVQLEDARKLVPRVGVYAVQVELATGGHYDGMMNVGVRPTFEAEGAVTVEVHLFDFDQDLYGRTVRVAVLERLRDELKFGGVDALVAQLHEDRRQAERVLAGLV